MACVAPPLTGCLPRLWNHRIHQYKQRDWHSCAYQRRCKPAQRLRDYADALWSPVSNCPNDGGSILRETGASIGRRQINRDNVIAALLQLRRDQVPVPCISARTGNENKSEAVPARRAFLFLPPRGDTTHARQCALTFTRRANVIDNPGVMLHARPSGACC